MEAAVVLFLLPLALAALARADASECIAALPAVREEQSYHNGYHGAANALLPGCGFGAHSRWVGPDHTAPAGFTLEYAGEVKTDGFYVRNSDNFGAKDRWGFW